MPARPPPVPGTMGVPDRDALPDPAVLRELAGQLFDLNCVLLDLSTAVGLGMNVDLMYWSGDAKNAAVTAGAEVRQIIDQAAEQYRTRSDEVNQWADAAETARKNKDLQDLLGVVLGLFDLVLLGLPVGGLITALGEAILGVVSRLVNIMRTVEFVMPAAGIRAVEFGVGAVVLGGLLGVAPFEAAMAIASAVTGAPGHYGDPLALGLAAGLGGLFAAPSLFRRIGPTGRPGGEAGKTPVPLPAGERGPGGANGHQPGENGAVATYGGGPGTSNPGGKGTPAHPFSVPNVKVNEVAVPPKAPPAYTAHQPAPRTSRETSDSPLPQPAPPAESPTGAAFESAQGGHGATPGAQKPPVSGLSTPPAHPAATSSPVGLVRSGGEPKAADAAPVQPQPLPPSGKGSFGDPPDAVHRAGPESPEAPGTPPPRSAAGSFDGGPGEVGRSVGQDPTSPAPSTQRPVDGAPPSRPATPYGQPGAGSHEAGTVVSRGPVEPEPGRVSGNAPSHPAEVPPDVPDALPSPRAKDVSKWPNGIDGGVEGGGQLPRYTPREDGPAYDINKIVKSVKPSDKGGLFDILEMHLGPGIKPTEPVVYRVELPEQPLLDARAGGLPGKLDGGLLPPGTAKGLDDRTPQAHQVESSSGLGQTGLPESRNVASEHPLAESPYSAKPPLGPAEDPARDLRRPALQRSPFDDSATPESILAQQRDWLENHWGSAQAAPRRVDGDPSPEVLDPRPWDEHVHQHDGPAPGPPTRDEVPDFHDPKPARESMVTGQQWAYSQYVKAMTDLEMTFEGVTPRGGGIVHVQGASRNLSGEQVATLAKGLVELRKDLNTAREHLVVEHQSDLSKALADRDPGTPGGVRSDPPVPPGNGPAEQPPRSTAPDELPSALHTYLQIKLIDAELTSGAHPTRVLQHLSLSEIDSGIRYLQGARDALLLERNAIGGGTAGRPPQTRAAGDSGQQSAASRSIEDINTRLHELNEQELLLANATADRFVGPSRVEDVAPNQESAKSQVQAQLQKINSERQVLLRQGRTFPPEDPRPAVRGPGGAPRPPRRPEYPIYPDVAPITGKLDVFDARQAALLQNLRDAAEATTGGSAKTGGPRETSPATEAAQPVSRQASPEAGPDFDEVLNLRNSVENRLTELRRIYHDVYVNGRPADSADLTNIKQRIDGVRADLAKTEHEMFAAKKIYQALHAEGHGDTPAAQKAAQAHADAARRNEWLGSELNNLRSRLASARIRPSTEHMVTQVSRSAELDARGVPKANWEPPALTRASGWIDQRIADVQSRLDGARQLLAAHLEHENRVIDGLFSQRPLSIDRNGAGDEFERWLSVLAIDRTGVKPSLVPIGEILTRLDGARRPLENLVASLGDRLQIQQIRKDILDHEAALNRLSELEHQRLRELKDAGTEAVTSVRLTTPVPAAGQSADGSRSPGYGEANRPDRRQRIAAPQQGQQAVPRAAADLATNPTAKLGDGSPVGVVGTPTDTSVTQPPRQDPPPVQPRHSTVADVPEETAVTPGGSLPVDGEHVLENRTDPPVPPDASPIERFLAPGPESMPVPPATSELVRTEPRSALATPGETAHIEPPTAEQRQAAWERRQVELTDTGQPHPRGTTARPPESELPTPRPLTFTLDDIPEKLDGELTSGDFVWRKEANSWAGVDHILLKDPAPPPRAGQFPGTGRLAAPANAVPDPVQAALDALGTDRRSGEQYLASGDPSERKRIARELVKVTGPDRLGAVSRIVQTKMALGSERAEHAVFATARDILTGNYRALPAEGLRQRMQAVMAPHASHLLKPQRLELTHMLMDQKVGQDAVVVAGLQALQEAMQHCYDEYGNVIGSVR